MLAVSYREIAYRGGRSLDETRCRLHLDLVDPGSITLPAPAGLKLAVSPDTLRREAERRERVLSSNQERFRAKVRSPSN